MARDSSDDRNDMLDVALGRLSSFAQRYPLAVDVALSTLIVLASLHQVIHRRSHGVEIVSFALALAVPLVWRNRWPLPVFMVLAAVAFVQWLAGVNVIADVALLIALYTVASREPRSRALLAAVVVETGALLAAHTNGGYREFVGLSALATAAGLLGISVRHRKALVASLEDRAARLELERDQQGQLAAAAERARIAREMHDIVAHNLSVMISLADGAVFAAERAPDDAVVAMESVSATGRQALTEMRRLLGVLRDDDGKVVLLPQPGVPEIDQLVEQVRAAGLPVELEVAGDGRALPAGAQLTVFRLVQEALTNTLKHAGASAGARVRLQYARDGIDVEITDTGRGVRPGAPGGRGLEGMRERAAVYAGTVEAGPRSGGGWRVHTHLSLDESAARG